MQIWNINYHLIERKIPRGYLVIQKLSHLSFLCLKKTQEREQCCSLLKSFLAPCPCPQGTNTALSFLIVYIIQNLQREGVLAFPSQLHFSKYSVLSTLSTCSSFPQILQGRKLVSSQKRHLTHGVFIYLPFLPAVIKICIFLPLIDISIK